MNSPSNQNKISIDEDNQFFDEWIFCVNKTKSVEDFLFFIKKAKKNRIILNENSFILISEMIMRLPFFNQSDFTPDNLELVLSSICELSSKSFNEFTKKVWHQLAYRGVNQKQLFH